VPKGVAFGANVAMNRPAFDVAVASASNGVIPTDRWVVRGLE